MKIKQNTTLKELQSRLNKLQAQLPLLKADVLQAEKNYTDALSRKKTLEESIAQIQSSSEEIRITEHALLRIAERKYGFNSEQETKEIVEQLRKYGSLAADGKIPIGHGLKAVLKGKTVVTVER